jgi:hypothetical protein
MFIICNAITNSISFEMQLFLIGTQKELWNKYTGKFYTLKHKIIYILK